MSLVEELEDVAARLVAAYNELDVREKERVEADRELTKAVVKAKNEGRLENWNPTSAELYDACPDALIGMWNADDAYHRALFTHDQCAFRFNVLGSRIRLLGRE